jgi:hypothetical protein
VPGAPYRDHRPAAYPDGRRAAADAGEHRFAPRCRAGRPLRPLVVDAGGGC